MPGQLVEIPFGGGINEDVDPRVLKPPYVQSVINGEFDKAGRATRRRGHTALSSSFMSGGSLSSSVRLASQDGGLVAFPSTSWCRYVPTEDKWATGNGWGPRILCDDRPLVRVSKSGSSEQSYHDIACNGSYVCVVWSDNVNSGAWVYERTVDGKLTDGPPILRVDMGATVHDIHVVSAGDYFVVLWTFNASGVLNHATIDATNPTAISATTVLANNVQTGVGDYFDVTAISSTEYVVAYRSTTPDVRLRRYATNSTMASATVTIAEDPRDCLGVFGVAGEDLYVGWHNGTGVRCAVLNPSTLAVTTAAVTVQAIGAANARQIAFSRETSSSVVVWWEYDVPTNKGTVRWRTITDAGSLGTQRELYRFQLQAKPYVYDGSTYVLLGYASTLQGACYTLRLNESGTSLQTIAVHMPRVSGVSRYVSNLTSVVSPLTGVFLVPTASKPSVASGGGSSVACIDEIIISHGAQLATDYRYLCAASSEHMWVTTGFVAVHDGREFREPHFFYGPESADMTATQVATGGNLSAGTYQIVATYEAVDSKGNVLQSAPSTPALSVAVNANDRITVTAANLQIAGWPHSGNVRIVFWRTLVDQSGPFYRWVVISNTPGSTAATTTSGIADDEISTRATLYTSQGRSDNVVPPAPKSIAVAQDRVFACRNKEIWYSDAYISGEVPGFHDTHVFTVEDGGDIVALATLDDRIVVFKDSAIYIVVGEGFSERAEGQNYIARPIASDVGCIEPRSIVLTPTGLLFQSQRGIELLGRDNSVAFVGAAVRDTLADYPIVTSAVVDPDRQLAIWTLVNSAGTSGKQVVLDYRRNQWAIWQLEGGAVVVSAAYHDGAYYYCLANGSVRKSSASTWQDAGTAYTFSAKSAWMNLAGLQGYQQVRRATLMLDRLGSHELSATVYANYNGTVLTEGYTWSAAEIDGLSREQLSIHLRNQKCQSMAVEISDGGANSAGCNVMAIALEVEAKRGSARHTLSSTARK